MKTRTLKFYVTFIGIILSIAVNAQPDREGFKEKVESQKIAFITQELNLTPEEAKVFWPVYNQYHNEIEAIHKSRKSEMMNAKLNFDEMSDADVSKLIDDEFNFQQKEIDLRKKYNADFKKVLPIKKVAKFYRSEQRFKLFLLRQMQQNRESGPGKDRNDDPGRPHPPIDPQDRN